MSTLLCERKRFFVCQDIPRGRRYLLVRVFVLPNYIDEPRIERR